MTIAANKTSPLLRALYRGRTDCYGSYNFDKGSHETVHEVLTEKNYEQHMSGQLFIGPYYLLDDSTCFLFSFDFDSPDFAPVKQVASLFMQRWGFPIENHFPDGSWRDNLRPQPMIPDNIFQFPLNV